MSLPFAPHPPTPDAPVLFVALGGGGDVISATLLAREALRLGGQQAVVASLAWERYVVDPLPGPRSPEELRGVRLAGDGAGWGWATPETAFPGGALSNQAMLCQLVPEVRQVLLNPWSGVIGLVSALKALASVIHPREVLAVDVGGDVLAGEPSPTLRSPLGDALMLSACWQAFPEARVAVLGLGADGELTPEEVATLWQRHLSAGYVQTLGTVPLDQVGWAAEALTSGALHSEVTAAVIRAAQGVHGQLLFREGRHRVMLSPDLLLMPVYAIQSVANDINPLARLLADTVAFQQASDRLEAAGFTSEWVVEQQRAERFNRERVTWANTPVTPDALLSALDAMAGAYPDVRWVSERYLAEVMQVSLSGCRQALSVLPPHRWASPFVRLR